MRISNDSIKWISKKITQWEKQNKRGGYEELGVKLNVSRLTASLWYRKHLNNELAPKTMPIPKNKFTEKFNEEIVSMYKTDINKLQKRLGKDIHRPTLKDFKLYGNYFYSPKIPGVF